MSERIRDMVRAFTVCAVFLAVGTASAQQAAVPTLAPAAQEPTIASVDGASVSTCDEHDCPVADSASTVDKPVDNHTLLKQKLAEMNCLQSEIDALRISTGTPQAVLVKLNVMEVSRNKLRDAGIDLDEMLKRGEVNATQLGKLRDKNIAKVISQPNIAAVCGRPASFMVGGEVPMPAVPGSSQAIEFKPFGTQVDVVATTRGENRVHLDLRARISEIDNTYAHEVAGKRVPGFRVRQVDSAFESELGQTVALSGTVEHRVEAHRVRPNQVVEVNHDIELIFLVTTEIATVPLKGDKPYHTATSTSEVNPAERSLRVKPYTPR